MTRLDRSNGALLLMLVLSLLVAFAAGCGSDEDEGNNDTSCTTDDDCGDKRICSNGQCEAVACKTDQDCQLGEICNLGNHTCVLNSTDGDNSNDGDTDAADGDQADGDNGGVVITPVDGDKDTGPEPDCYDDGDCYGNDYCDEENGICRRRLAPCEPCDNHRECGHDDDYCLPDSYGNVCGRYCSASDPCPTDYDCLPIAELNTNQCVFSSGIANGQVGDNCCTNENCAEPLVCNTLTGKCFEGCGSGSACPAGMVCYDDPSDSRNGYCQIGCLINKDCLGGEVCYNGKCLEGDCVSKDDCPLEHLCDVSTFSCIPGCEVDADCSAYNECLIPDGKTEYECVERIGCDGTYQCALAQMCTTEGRDLSPEERGCCFNPKHEADGECSNPFGVQKFCDPCTDTNNQNQECGADGACFELKDEDVSLGYFCLIKWDCTVNTDDGVDQGTVMCPRGYSCMKMEDGQFAGKYCVADCTNELFQQ